MFTDSKLASIDKKCVIAHFSLVRDPRLNRNKKHSLLSIIVMSLYAILADCDEWVEIHDFCTDNEHHFKEFLDLSNGIPSIDTFKRVFSIIDPEDLEQSLLQWVESIAQKKPKQFAIDGKSLRRSYEDYEDDDGLRALHLLNVWERENGLIFAQEYVDCKTNEITVIPKVLEKLNLEGTVVSTDALGAQTKIAKLITDGKGHYLLGLKENHSNIYEDVELLASDQEEIINVQNCSASYFKTIDKQAGRIEIREYHRLTDIKMLRGFEQWVDLQSIIMVISTRESNGAKSVENRFYLTSIPNDAAIDLIADHIRGHWEVENLVHYQLDVTFKEDALYSLCKECSRNLSVLRKVALNLLHKKQKQEEMTAKKLQKKSKKRMRKSASRNFNYIHEIIMNPCSHEI